MSAPDEVPGGAAKGSGRDAPAAPSPEAPQQMPSPEAPQQMPRAESSSATTRSEQGSSATTGARMPSAEGSTPDRLASLRGLSARPLWEHIDVYQHLHRDLQTALAAIDGA